MSTTTHNPDNTVTVEIAGLEITLPVKFTAGYVPTDNQAKAIATVQWHIFILPDPTHEASD